MASFELSNDWHGMGEAGHIVLAVVLAISLILLIIGICSIRR